MATTQIYPSIASRDWQQDALRKLDSLFVSAQQNTMVVEACPASGKTRLSVAAAKHMKDLGLIDFVIVLTPTTTLRIQWQKVLRDNGLDVKDVGSEIIHGYREHCDGVTGAIGIALDDGFAITSQLATTERVGEDLKAILATKRHKVLVVVDEVHHHAEGSSWGYAIAESLSKADYFLGLTGTPYRSDDMQISLLKYKSKCVEEIDGPIALESLCGEADFQYSYAQALKDGIALPMVFLKEYGQFEVDRKKDKEGFVSETMTFEDGEDGTGFYIDPEHGGIDYVRMNDRLRAALDKNSEFPEAVLSDSIAQLSKLRQTLAPDAGGLVVCTDIAAAKRAHKFLVSQGQTAVLVTSEGTSSKDFASAAEAVGQYANDPGYEWLVSVRMVNEGIDIPRIHLVTYLTTIKTGIFFTQTIARATRFPKKVADAPLEERLAYSAANPAHIIIPADPRLVEFAEKCEKEVVAFMQQVINTESGEVYGQIGAAKKALDELSEESRMRSHRMFVRDGQKTKDIFLDLDKRDYSDAERRHRRDDLIANANLQRDSKVSAATFVDALPNNTLIRLSKLYGSEEVAA